MSARDSKISQGIFFEYRVARLLFTQGAFVRRSIDVWSASGETTRQLAEIDCVAVNFDHQLRRRLEVVECKTTSRNTKESDRVLWLIGIGRLAGADNVVFAKTSISEPVRKFARQVDVGIIDLQTVEELERDLGITKDWWPGLLNPNIGETRVKAARQRLSASPDLMRAGRVLFGSYWFLDDFTRVKQLRRLFLLLAEHETHVDEDAFVLGIVEATVLLALTAVSIGSWRSQLPEREFRNLIKEELTTGLGDPRGLRVLLRRVDDLHRDQVDQLHGAYESRFGQRLAGVVPSFETQLLVPPEWTDAFVDLALRLWRRSYVANDLLRWLDLWAARVFGTKSVPEMPVSLFRSSEEDLRAAAELIFVFLRQYWDVPSYFFMYEGEKMIADTHEGNSRPDDIATEGHSDRVDDDPTAVPDDMDRDGK